jgi:GNAT superfamily N-acetyltransferase
MTSFAASITDARPEEMTLVRELFEEYAASLPFGLEFQNFHREVQQLPGDYAPPGGTILLARTGAGLVGCIAVRPIDEATCEMKRLYVRPAGRGTGTGRALASAAIEKARALGYATMKLDTVPFMEGAIRLYRSLGFRETAPYRVSPIAGALFFERDLRE